MLRADCDAVIPITGPSPAAAQARRGLGQHPGLAGAGRGVDHRHALAVGQDRQRRGGLVLAQPGLACAWSVRARRARPVSASSSCAGSAPSACAACARVRRGAPLRAGLREHAFFHGQLRAGGVPGAAVPLVDAAAVGAQQAARDLGRLGGFQADDRLELRAQRAVGQVLEQRGGRGRVQAGAGQDPAQVLDHVRAGPGALFLLRQRDRLLRRAGQLELGEDRAVWVRASCAAARPVASCHTDGATDASAHAEGARELVRPARVQLRDIQRAVLGVARA